MVSLLTAARRQPKMGGDKAVPNTRKETENLGDARGQFGLYLRHWLDRQADRAAAKARIAKAAGVSIQAVGKWEQGVSGPPMQSLHAIADVMGFANWASLATAAVRFYESQ